MTERTDAYAYFWTACLHDAPETISLKLGLEPTSIEVIGSSRANAPQRIQRWVMQSPLARGDTLLQDQIEALLGMLEPHSNELMELLESCEVGINCVGYYYGSNPGLHLSARLISRLAALCVPVDFDLYNYSEAERVA